VSVAKAGVLALALEAIEHKFKFPDQHHVSRDRDESLIA
jgi:hypothetical protein